MYLKNAKYIEVFQWKLYSIFKINLNIIWYQIKSKFHDRKTQTNKLMYKKRINILV